LTALLTGGLAIAAPQTALAQTQDTERGGINLPIPDPAFKGKIGKTFKKSRRSSPPACRDFITNSMRMRFSVHTTRRIRAPSRPLVAYSPVRPG
jgi:hypothetical protein